MTATGRVADVFADAAVRGWMHAVPVSGGRAGGGRRGRRRRPGGHGVGVQVSARRRVLPPRRRRRPRPAEQVTLDPSTRTTGPHRRLADVGSVRMSLRDMARSMMAMSDNAAADELLRRVGVDRVNETMRSLGLSPPDRRWHVGHSRVAGGRHRTRSPAEAFAAIGDNDSVVFPRGYDPVLSSATTPRDMTTLLSAVWSGAVLSADQTAFVRAVMASQIFTARLRSGFPFADVVVAGNRNARCGPKRGGCHRISRRRRVRGRGVPRVPLARTRCCPGPMRRSGSGPHRDRGTAQVGLIGRAPAPGPRNPRPVNLEWRKRSREPTSPAAAVNHSQSCPQCVSGRFSEPCRRSAVQQNTPPAVMMGSGRKPCERRTGGNEVEI
ncbi:hypothetical protein GS432_10965 [Rhodococcus hoagii]|nr:hypothetical protein [Prescottella equi]